MVADPQVDVIQRGQCKKQSFVPALIKWKEIHIFQIPLNFFDTTETEENFDLRELIFNLKMFSFSYRVQYIYSNDCHRTAKGRNLQPWQSTQTCPTCLNFKHFRSLGEFNIKPQKFMYLSINKLVCGRFHDIKRAIYIIHSSISAVFFCPKTLHVITSDAMRYNWAVGFSHWVLALRLFLPSK